MDHQIAVRRAGFQQQHIKLARCAQLAGQHAPGRACANNHIIELCLFCHNRPRDILKRPCSAIERPFYPKIKQSLAKRAGMPRKKPDFTGIRGKSIYGADTAGH